jgi:hypothetical protein
MAAVTGKMKRDREQVERIGQRWSEIQKVSKIVIKYFSLPCSELLKEAKNCF